jgi:hypothetical protein
MSLGVRMILIYSREWPWPASGWHNLSYRSHFQCLLVQQAESHWGGGRGLSMEDICNCHKRTSSGRLYFKCTVPACRQHPSNHFWIQQWKWHPYWSWQSQLEGAISDRSRSCFLARLFFRASIRVQSYTELELIDRLQFVPMITLTALRPTDLEHGIVKSLSSDANCMISCNISMADRHGSRMFFGRETRHRCSANLEFRNLQFTRVWPGFLPPSFPSTPVDRCGWGKTQKTKQENWKQKKKNRTEKTLGALMGRSPYPSTRGRIMLTRARERSIGFAAIHHPGWHLQVPHTQTACLGWPSYFFPLSFFCFFCVFENWNFC